jgi:hypothetical protein
LLEKGLDLLFRVESHAERVLSFVFLLGSDIAIQSATGCRWELRDGVSNCESRAVRGGDSHVEF